MTRADRGIKAIALLLVVTGCGRVGFASHGLPDGGSMDASAEAGRDSSTPPADGRVDGARDSGVPPLDSNVSMPDGGTSDAAVVVDASTVDAGPCPPSCDGMGAASDLLILKTGDPDWLPLSGPTIGPPYGTFRYLPSGPTFIYRFEAIGLDPATTYSLISYTDPYPGNPAIELARGAPTGDGTLVFPWTEREMNRDLNDVAGKIWLINSAHLDVAGEVMTVWEPAGILFEDVYIDYDDTDVP